jgi:hypothetical protein
VKQKNGLAVHGHVLGRLQTCLLQIVHTRLVFTGPSKSYKSSLIDRYGAQGYPALVPYSQEVSEPPTHDCEDVHSQYKVGISKLQSDVSRALLRGHASSQSTARRLYTAAVATTQRTVTRAVSARADKVPAALHEPTRLRATNRRRQPADRGRMDARCSKLPAPLTGSVALSAVTKGAAAGAAAAA